MRSFHLRGPTNRCAATEGVVGRAPGTDRLVTLRKGESGVRTPAPTCCSAFRSQKSRGWMGRGQGAARSANLAGARSGRRCPPPRATSGHPYAPYHLLVARRVVALTRKSDTEGVCFPGCGNGRPRGCTKGGPACCRIPLPIAWPSGARSSWMGWAGGRGRIRTRPRSQAAIRRPASVRRVAGRWGALLERGRPGC